MRFEPEGGETSARTRTFRARIGRLHVLTDEVLQQRFSHVDLARLAVLGGADVVQYREKRPRRTRELVETAAAISRAVQAAATAGPGGSQGAADVQIVVDDRADVALAIRARGLHLGRDDLDPAVARSILGPSALLGGTANSLAEARLRFGQDFDYLGVGPVYGTTSKQDPAAPLGVEALAIIAREAPVPVIAIGSITPERVLEVLEAGAHGVAVLSGIACAPDPTRAAARYREAIEVFLSRRPATERGAAGGSLRRGGGIAAAGPEQGSSKREI